LFFEYGERRSWYFFSLLMTWSSPDISADRLLFNVLWSAWIVAGAMLEEKDMNVYPQDLFYFQRLVYSA